MDKCKRHCDIVSRRYEFRSQSSFGNAAFSYELLGVGGHTEPVFVIATDTEANRVYVGEGHAHKGLSRFCLRVAPGEIHWIRTDLAMQPGEMRRYRVRIRYRQPLQSATLIRRESGLYILFDAPQRGISPGQFAVWYDGEEMLGSGVI